MSHDTELLLRWEARVMLSALRCAVLASGGCPFAGREFRDGLARFDAAAAQAPLTLLVQLLLEHAADRIEWHHPTCSCVSAGEMTLLHMLSGLAARPDEGSAPDPWWVTLVPAAVVPSVDRAATDSLAALYVAGIHYPLPGALVKPASSLAVPAIAGDLGMTLQ